MKVFVINKVAIVCFLLSFIHSNLNAQINFSENYSPLSRNPPPKSELDQIAILNQQSPLLKVQKYQKEFKVLNRQVEEYFKNKIDSSNYYFDDVINPYIQNIFQNIIKSNPLVQSLNLKLLVSRLTIPNAFAMPNGYIEIHLGLLRHAENESQIAFILAHEIAHVKLQHFIRRYTNLLDHYYSKETQKEYKDIKNSEYGTYTKYNEFAKNLTYNSRKHSREFEFEADSMGLLLLSKTPYSVTDGSQILKLFKTIDQEKYKDSLQLDKIFHTETYPFKPRWIKETNFIKATDTLSQSYLDSMTTHPDSDLRYQNAEKILASLNHTDGKKFIQDSSLFELIKTASDFECVSNLYHNEFISLSLYLNLKLLKVFPDNIFLKEMLHKNLDKIKEGLESMKLSYYVEKPNPFSTGDYKYLVLLLNSLRHSEITPLTEEMKKKYQIKQTK